MKKRIVTIALVVALLATCFAGTYAYLIDSESVENTFTTGQVYITLTETGAVNGKNSYHLIPGSTYTKNPTITVDAGSEDAWIAAKITFTNADAYALLSGGVLKNTDAVEVVMSGNVAYVYVKAAQKANAKVVLFDTLTVPETWGNTEIAAFNNMKITVEAYGVQAYGFANCQAAMQTAFPTAFPTP